jgi:maleate isomerase
MLPPGVVAYITRLPLTGSESDELLAMASQADSAAALLADADVQTVVFHCTAASTFSSELHDEILKRIDNSSRRPSFATADAIVNALRVLRAKRIVLLTPYTESVNLREINFLSDHGIEVMAHEGLGLNTNAEMALLPAQVFFDLTLKHACAEADAYFISCTAVKSAEVIERLEVALGRPVITSNQAMVWNALRTCKIEDHVHGFGQLFTY